MREKPQPLFACTFHCPVCGEEMEFEHTACKAKHSLLTKEVVHLSTALVDLTEAYSRDRYTQALEAGQGRAIKEITDKTVETVKGEVKNSFLNPMFKHYPYPY